MNAYSAAGTAANQGGNLLDPVAMSHRFVVLIDNGLYHFGSWAKVTGLSVSWAVIEHRVGDAPNQVWNLPGTTKYEPLVLSRAACRDSLLVQRWLARTSKNPQPQCGVVQLVDYLGLPVVQWRLAEFYPVGWSIEALDAAGAKPAVETLKIVHSGFLDDGIALRPDPTASADNKR